MAGTHNEKRQQTSTRELPHWTPSGSQRPTSIATAMLHGVALIKKAYGASSRKPLILLVGHVDLAGKTLTVVAPKNGRDHTLPLPDYLLALLSRRKTVARPAIQEDRVALLAELQAAVEAQPI